MPGYVRDGSKGGNLSQKLDKYYVHCKEIFNQKSPRSPLSTHSLALSSLSYDSDSLDFAIDVGADNSIEQLYQNICEIQSSDQSPSGLSFYSYGEESRIDSELRFLAGGDYGAVEDQKEVEIEKNGGHSSFEEDGGMLKDEILEDLSKSTSPIRGNSQKPILRSKGCNGKPPTGKQSVRGLKRFNHVSPLKKGTRAPFVGKKWRNGTGDQREAGYLGPYLLKQARNLMASGDNNSRKALELALRAMKSFEYSANIKPSLDFVMCLHVVGALYCRVGRYADAIPILERSIEIPVIELGENHALAKFAGCMQLGDTYAMLNQIENAILFYKSGLVIQRQVLGEKDIQYGETCRYIAEAHVQVMQFDDAERLCLVALDIHKENKTSASLEEAADRMLLGLICDSKGDYEGSLKHYILARMIVAAYGQIVEVAAVECNIGDAYLSLERYDEAIFAYQKALNTFKSCKGDNHSLVASAFICLADLYNKMGNVSESKSYCESALHIYNKPSADSLPEEIASGFVDLSAIYESMNEPNRALVLLQKAVKIYGSVPCQQSVVAGIEAQMGSLYYILGSYFESCSCLKNAILKFRAIRETKSALFGIALNQFGLACVQLSLINEAVDLFEEARSVMETVHGRSHADTLGVCSNLAGAYDAMGRTNDAIEVLEYVVDVREKLGAPNADCEYEKSCLHRLLKEKGMVKKRNSNSLPMLD